MKHDELENLPPFLLQRIVAIEANAQENLTVISGLWMRKRMTDYIRKFELLPPSEVDQIWNLWTGNKRPIKSGDGQNADDVLEQFYPNPPDSGFEQRHYLTIQDVGNGRFSGYAQITL